MTLPLYINRKEVPGGISFLFFVFFCLSVENSPSDFRKLRKSPERLSPYGRSDLIIAGLAGLHSLTRGI